MTTRRAVLGGLAALPIASRVSAQDRGRVVVVGGGYGGATAARFLARAGHDVTLVERDPVFVSCPFSNTVIGGLNGMEAITYDWAGLRADGVRLVQDEGTGLIAQG